MGDPPRKNKLEKHRSEDMRGVLIDYITIVLRYP